MSPTGYLPDLQDAIAAAGLLDENPDGEAIRNVIASPLAGLDPDALFDIRPVVAALEARLTGDAELYALPAKFCFVIDDGGRFGRWATCRRIYGSRPCRATTDPDSPFGSMGAPDEALGPCRPDAVVADTAAALAMRFSARRGERRSAGCAIWSSAIGGAAAIAEAASPSASTRSRARRESVVQAPRRLDGSDVTPPLRAA